MINPYLPKAKNSEIIVIFIMYIKEVDLKLDKNMSFIFLRFTETEFQDRTLNGALGKYAHGLCVEK